MSGGTSITCSTAARSGQMTSRRGTSASGDSPGDAEPVRRRVEMVDDLAPAIGDLPERRRELDRVERRRLQPPEERQRRQQHHGQRDRDEAGDLLVPPPIENAAVNENTMIPAK